MLYLFPNVLDESQEYKDFISATVEAHVGKIDGLIAESEKSARAFLKRFSFTKERTFREIPIKLLNEHTEKKELQELIEPLRKGQVWGVVSDCGLPCIADPGANLVALAHRYGLPVKTFSGPSSIMMALILSGQTAQQFTFYGYLPRELPQLQQQLSKMVTEVAKEGRTQVFIEAPYRNVKLLQTLIQTLPNHFMLSVVCDVTLDTEEVVSLPVSQWKERDCERYHKRPAVFLFGCLESRFKL